MTYKRADLASIFPAVAGPALGGFAGQAIGARFKQPALGGLIGGITGGTAGQLLKERVESNQDIPPGAPYSLDATSADIPPWVLQGAQLLQPAMKQGAHDHEPMSDVILGEVPGANVVKDTVQRGPAAGLRAFGGMAMGGVPGGLLGTLGAKGIEHLVGHSVRVPGLNMSLSDLLGSVGGAVGATKGLRFMQS
jgi:hypothetical protein